MTASLGSNNGNTLKARNIINLISMRFNFQLNQVVVITSIEIETYNCQCKLSDQNVIL